MIPWAKNFFGTLIRIILVKQTIIGEIYSHFWYLLPLPCSPIGIHLWQWLTRGSAIPLFYSWTQRKVKFPSLSCSEVGAVQLALFNRIKGNYFSLPMKDMIFHDLTHCLEVKCSKIAESHDVGNVDPGILFLDGTSQKNSLARNICIRLCTSVK